MSAAGSEAGASLLLAEGGGGYPTEGVKKNRTALNTHSYSKPTPKFLLPFALSGLFWGV